MKIVRFTRWIVWLDVYCTSWQWSPGDAGVMVASVGSIVLRCYRSGVVTGRTLNKRTAMLWSAPTSRRLATLNLALQMFCPWSSSVRRGGWCSAGERGWAPWAGRLPWRACASARTPWSTWCGSAGSRGTCVAGQSCCRAPPSTCAAGTAQM